MRKHKEKKQTNKLNKTKQKTKKTTTKKRVETVLHPLLSCIEV